MFRNSLLGYLVDDVFQFPLVYKQSKWSIQISAEAQCVKITQNVAFQVFNFFAKMWTIFGIFNELLSTQNVARFAPRNVEWDFFCTFSNTVLKEESFAL